MSSILSRDQIKEAWEISVGHYRVSIIGTVSRETYLDPSFLNPLPDKVWARLELFALDVLDANSRVNLVSRKDPERQILDNILESVFLAVVLRAVPRETPNPSLLLDAGSGSGVPGIPIKLIQEEDQIQGGLILVDSVQKKARVLSSLVSKLDLQSTEVFGDRFENPKLAELCQKLGPDFDWILCSKAFASTENTLAWSEALKPRLKAAYLIKGPAGLAEVQGGIPKKYGWKVAQTYSFRFPHRESFVIELTPRIG